MRRRRRSWVPSGLPTVQPPPTLPPRRVRSRGPSRRRTAIALTAAAALIAASGVLARTGLWPPTRWLPGPDAARGRDEPSEVPRLARGDDGPVALIAAPVVMAVDARGEVLSVDPGRPVLDLPVLRVTSERAGALWGSARAGAGTERGGRDRSRRVRGDLRSSPRGRGGLVPAGRFAGSPEVPSPDHAPRTSARRSLRSTEAMERLDEGSSPAEVDLRFAVRTAGSDDPGIVHHVFVADGRSAMRSALIAGLDVGSSRTRAVIGEYVRERRCPTLRVRGVGETPTEGVRRGRVNDIDAAADCIGSALVEAETMASARVDRVYVGVGGEHVRVERSIGVVAVEDDAIVDGDVNRVNAVAQAVPLHPDAVVLHAIPQEYSVDRRGGVPGPCRHDGRAARSRTVPGDGERDRRGQPDPRRCQGGLQGAGRDAGTPGRGASRGGRGRKGGWASPSSTWEAS